jgi:hypothetical protein
VAAHLAVSVLFSPLYWNSAISHGHWGPRRDVQASQPRDLTWLNSCWLPRVDRTQARDRQRCGGKTWYAVISSYGLESLLYNSYHSPTHHHRYSWKPPTFPPAASLDPFSWTCEAITPRWIQKLTRFHAEPPLPSASI